MIIAVDFDGTIVEHRFPEIGQPIDNAFEALLSFKDKGYKLILWTCRNDEDPANNGRKVLTEAVEFCRARGLEFDAVNANVPGLGFNPTPKVYADMYIDDRSRFPFWEMFSDNFGLNVLPPYFIGCDYGK